MQPWNELTVVVMDDKGITQVNREFLNEDRPTDVISFTYPPLPGEQGNSGEMFINVERAVQVSRDLKAASCELALYAAHGIDHLSGSSDDTPAQRSRMLRREQAWLKNCPLDIETLILS